MPRFVPAPKRIHSKPRYWAPAPTPPAALELIAATYVAGTSLTLTFNQAVDVGGLNPVGILVDDGPITGSFYEASGAVTINSPSSFTVGLVAVEGSESAQTLLIATDENGIVSSDEGEAWAGTDGTVLPF